MVSLFNEDVGSDQRQRRGADRPDGRERLPDWAEHLHDPSERPLRLAVSTLLPLFPNRLYAAPLGELARRGNLHPSAFDGRAAPMKLVPFEMERWQSTWEHSVEFNLSESGVEPLPLRELLRDEASVEHFLNHPLAYSQGNGTPELRSSIAGMYRGATPAQVLVTNGSSEACLLALWHLVEPGDEVVLMLPNYMESWGLVQMFGRKIRPLWLREDLGLP